MEKQTFPYTSYIRDNMNSIVRQYNNNNYETTGIHTNIGSFYNRKNVYKYMGFDKTIFSENMENPEYKAGNISDNEFANQIIKQYESNKGKKFIFGVTMQNHMPYESKEYTNYDIEVSSDILDEDKRIELQNYVQGVYDGTKMYMKLQEYLKKIDENTVLIMFGDHIPYLQDYKVYEESNYTKIDYYTVPYIIWANYDIDLSRIPSFMSPCNLGINVLEISNITLPWYLKEFQSLYKEYPIINNNVIYDKEGKIHAIDEINNRGIVNRCRILQYDLLIAKKYISIN